MRRGWEFRRKDGREREIGRVGGTGGDSEGGMGGLGKMSMRWRKKGTK